MRTPYSHLTDVELTRIVSLQDCSTLEHELNERLIRATQGRDAWRVEDVRVTGARLKAMVPVEHNVGPEANNV
jgi:hypothetical protein